MKKNKVGKVIWGLLFIAAAGIVILNVLGLMGEVNAWTLIISIPLAFGIIYSTIKFEWSGTFLLSAVLAFIYRRNIEELLNIELNIFILFGVAILLMIGFYILFGKRQPKYDTPKFLNNSSNPATGEKLFFAAERFSGTVKYINSTNLSYLGIKNQFAGMDVYFENTTLTPGGATVNIENSFGGVELHIPREWNVIDKVSNFAGGIDYPEFAWVEGAPTLTICGKNSFGGIDVTRR